MSKTPKKGEILLQKCRKEMTVAWWRWGEVIRFWKCVGRTNRIFWGKFISKESGLSN